MAIINAAPTLQYKVTHECVSRMKTVAYRVLSRQYSREYKRHKKKKKQPQEVDINGRSKFQEREREEQCGFAVLSSSQKIIASEEEEEGEDIRLNAPGRQNAGAGVSRCRRQARKKSLSRFKKKNNKKIALVEEREWAEK